MIKKHREQMPRQLARARRDRLGRFLLVGTVNAAFGFLVYSVAILLSAPVWFALLSGMCAGIVFNFFTTGGIVFRDTSIRRAPRFVACYLTVYTVNYVSINMLARWVDSVIVAQALLTPVMAGIAYILMSRFVFRNSTDPL